MTVGTEIERAPSMRILINLSLGLAFFAVTSATTADDASGLMDPTRPYSGRTLEAAAPTGPVLQSTIVTPSERRAMIGGRFYRVGDHVGEAQVADIQPNRVILRRAGRDVTLSMFPRFTPEMKHEVLSAN